MASANGATGRHIDVSTAVPLLLGVIGATEDDAGGAEVAAAFAAIVRELRLRSPQTPVAVLTPLTTGPERAAIAAAREAAIPVIRCIAAARSAGAAADAGESVAITHEAGGDPRERVVWASDILIAISSGPAPRELLAIVERRRSGEPPGAAVPRLLAPPEVGPCFLIEGALVRRFFPPHFRGDDEGERRFHEALARRDRFNADIGAIERTEGRTALERLRERTAAVAGALQRRTHAWQRVLYGLAFLAATIEIVAIVPNGPYVKLAAVVFAFAVYFFVRRCDYQNRYQDYRAISEALRVQVVWSSIGIPDGVEESYLPMQQTDLQWIRGLLRAAHFLDRCTASGSCAEVSLWAASQRTYFADRSRAEARRRHAFELAEIALAVTSLVASAAAIVTSLVRPQDRELVLGIGMLAAWSALCVALARSYSHTRGYSENANRYQRMFFVFDRAAALLERCDADPGRVATVARELGHEALSEHAEWLLSQRERPIAVVHASAG